MSYTLYNAVGNGAQANPGLNALQLQYLSDQFNLSQSIRTQVRTDARFATRYDAISRRIEETIDRWQRKYGYSDADTGIYYDVNNLPYKKNGDILVIVNDNYTQYNAAGVPIGTPVPTKTPYFDLRFNRVVIPTAAIERMRLGEIQILRSGGNINVASDWQNLTLADTIMHEPGHRSESSTSSSPNAARQSWSNLAVDNDAEWLQLMGRVVQGLPGTVPHGNAANSAGTRLPSIRYKDASGNWVLVRTQADVNNMWGSPITSTPQTRIIKGLDGEFYVVDDFNGRTTSISPAGGSLGRMAGSSLGNYLAREDGVLVQIAASTVLGSIGQAFGNALSINVAANDLSRSFEAAFSDFDQTLYNNLKGAAVGALTSFATMELGRALGLKGFGAELFGVASGTAVSPILDKVLSNLGAGQVPFKDFSLKEIFGGTSSFGDVLGAGLASFFGAKLGALVISPTTSAGAALASVGSAAGAYALSAAGSKAIGGIAAQIFGKLGTFGNVLGPGIGAFVGFVLGALLGKLFGSKKPRIPTASADVLLDLSSTQYQFGAVSVANNGNRALVVNMATVARDTLNGIISQVVGGNAAYNANLASPTQTYGHNGNQIRAKFMNGAWQNFDSADKAVDWGILNAIQATKIRGGNIFQKRIIASATTTSVPSLLGNLQLAYDYELYLQNREVINSMIRDNPRSDFSAAWIVTLGRVDELGVNEFQASDFYGGLGGFAESFGFGLGSAGGSLGSGYENLSIAYEGTSVRISTSDGSGAFSLLTGSNNITDQAVASQSALIANFGANVGYTNWTGEATAGNDIWLAGGSGSAVTMDDTGTQWVGYWDPYWGYYYQYPVTVSGGDDIFVGSNYNDALYGRSGWDWLDGGGGNDLIEGGENDDVILGRAGSDRMLGGTGNDYIAGGDGDDYFFDANQTWGLYGGDGDDIFVGGAGLDSPYGENGNDLFIIDQDGGGVWDAIDGQAGLDTVSYERFNSGVYVDFAVTGGWSWNPQAKSIYGDSIANVENVTGSQYNDSILGDAIANVVRGLGGDDGLYGRDGNDVLDGGAGADYLDGGSGEDTASYEHSTNGVVVNLGSAVSLGGEATGDYFSSIEDLRGSKFGDELAGDAGNNVIAGLGGDDRFTMTAGYDTLDGGSGLDTLDASAATSALSLYYDGGWYDPYYGYYPGAGWVAYAASLGTTTFSSIEGFIGTAYADSISGDYGDEYYEGGAGNDTLYGSMGSDTYVFGRGDGYDSISETNDGANGIILKDGINWRDISISGASYNVANGNLVVSIFGTGDQIVVGSNFSYVNSGSNAGNHNHKIKSLTLAGLSTLDIDMIDWTPGGAATDAATVVYGAQNRADLIFAYGGADVIYAAGNATAYETRGNVIYAGDGNDLIYSSYGDDQYVFERGNGADTLTDAGGMDTIVMGPSVAAGDVIYQVVVTNPGASADLYIGLRDAANPGLTASQVADQIRVVGGGTKLVGMYYGTESFSTTEYLRVEGQEIDLTKADIAWETAYYYDGGYYWPVALDLDGDGIELRSVEGSRIASVEADGTITRMGWLGQDDGFLALDRNGDGAIDRIGEISFIGDVAGARSDLEGLAAYDSNGDGRLDAADKRFGEFQVWQDRNQDGYGSADELVSLEQAGLRSISLTGQATGFTQADGLDNVVLATAEIEWADSRRTGSAHDVALARLQVRTDGGGAAARGGAGDPLDAALYGVQTLSEEQVAAIRQAKAAAAKEGDAGLIYRIETLLDSGAASKNGLYTIDAGTAAGLSAAARRHGIQDPFASSAWTLAGSVAEGERDTRGDDAAFTELVQTDAQKAAIEAARRKVAADKAAAEAAAADQAARDAASSELRPAPAPPTAREAARLAREDRFRLLGTDTDAETAARLAGEADKPAESEDSQAEGVAQPLDTPIRASDAGVGPAAAASPSAQRAAVASGGRSQDIQGPQSTDGVNESAYGVVIRTANARLVQALANFGEAPAMMTRYQGLNSANDPQAAWLTVDAMPSIQKLASIR